MFDMPKLVAQIFRRFDFDLENPQKEWSQNNVRFVKPSDLLVKARPLSRMKMVS
jgi:hypothetical protein